ncbi:MAG: NAD+ synthase [bacterium]|nr:NAD+ synthase [bacterium]
MDALRLDCIDIEKILTRFISDEFCKAGKRQAVIGLSGGLDSSTAAFLAVKALGADNVLAYLLPYRTSSPTSSDDAALVADTLGISREIIDITAMVDTYLALVPQAGQVRTGNIAARQRMIILYDKSAEHNALVLGTANKTEYLLGYTTLWGDMACALTPLGDLYKTQVRQLARYLGVPDRILLKPPSADLWEGQTDEGELGFSYEAVDQLLYHMIDRQCTMSELQNMGYKPAFINKVSMVIKNSQYKRRMPLTIEISSRTTAPDSQSPRKRDA